MLELPIEIAPEPPLYILLGVSSNQKDSDSDKCINTYLTGRFMYKIYHKEVPDIFDDSFMYNYHIHDYYTRVSSHLHVPLASTNLSKTGIRYQGAIVWNNILTADINLDCSELSFKVMLKQCINQKLIQI